MATKKTAKKSTAKKTAAKKKATAKKTAAKPKLAKRHTFEVIEGGDIGQFKVRDDSDGKLYEFDHLEDHLEYDDVDFVGSEEFAERGRELLAQCMPPGMLQAIRDCPAPFGARIYIEHQFATQFTAYLNALAGASAGE